MKASELRIRNFVYEDNGNVAEIRGSHIVGTITVIFNKFPPKIEQQSVKLIKPITLTEEWLLKFGFKKVKDTCITIESFHYENKNCWIYLIENGFEFELITLSERHNLCKTYKFVHELQNIYFAITGEELPVV